MSVEKIINEAWENKEQVNQNSASDNITLIASFTPIAAPKHEVETKI